MLFEEAHAVHPSVDAKCRSQGVAPPCDMLVSFSHESLTIGPGKITGGYSIKQQW